MLALRRFLFLTDFAQEFACGIKPSPLQWEADGVEGKNVSSNCSNSALINQAVCPDRDEN